MVVQSWREEAKHAMENGAGRIRGYAHPPGTDVSTPAQQVENELS